MNPVHILTSYYFKIHFNIIFRSTPKRPKWCRTLRFQKNKVMSFLSFSQVL